MELPRHDIRADIANRKPVWLAEGDNPDSPASDEDLPFRLIQAQHAVDVAIASPLHDAAAHYGERLEAARVAQIAAHQATALDLELLVRDALRAFLFGAAPGVIVDGPVTLVRSAAAVLLALALHELTTNSIKFGALAGHGRNPRLQIHWTITQNGIELSWQESGVPIVQTVEARRNGFGRYLIDAVLPAQLGAATRFELLPGGIVCTLCLPNNILAD